MADPHRATGSVHGGWGVWNTDSLCDPLGGRHFFPDPSPPTCFFQKLTRRASFQGGVVSDDMAKSNSIPGPGLFCLIKPPEAECEFSQAPVQPRLCSDNLVSFFKFLCPSLEKGSSDIIQPQPPPPRQKNACKTLREKSSVIQWPSHHAVPPKPGDCRDSKDRCMQSLCFDRGPRRGGTVNVLGHQQVIKVVPVAHVATTLWRRADGMAVICGYAACGPRWEVLFRTALWGWGGVGGATLGQMWGLSCRFAQFRKNPNCALNDKIQLGDDPRRMGKLWWMVESSSIVALVCIFFGFLAFCSHPWGEWMAFEIEMRMHCQLAIGPPNWPKTCG